MRHPRCRSVAPASAASTAAAVTAPIPAASALAAAIGRSATVVRIGESVRAAVRAMV